MLAAALLVVTNSWSRDAQLPQRALWSVGHFAASAQGALLVSMLLISSLNSCQLLPRLSFQMGKAANCLNHQLSACPGNLTMSTLRVDACLRCSGGLERPDGRVRAFLSEKSSYSGLGLRGNGVLRWTGGAWSLMGDLTKLLVCGKDYMHVLPSFSHACCLVL